MDGEAVKGKALIVGNIAIVDEPEELADFIRDRLYDDDDEIERHSRIMPKSIQTSLLIQFGSAEDVRQALKDGYCKFGFLEEE